jgi:hypothetical protein
MMDAMHDEIHDMTPPGQLGNHSLTRREPRDHIMRFAHDVVGGVE